MIFPYGPNAVTTTVKVFVHDHQILCLIDGIRARRGKAHRIRMSLFQYLAVNVEI